MKVAAENTMCMNGESAINYIPDEPDIEIELAFLGEGKRFDPDARGACQLSRQVLW